MIVRIESPNAPLIGRIAIGILSRLGSYTPVIVMHRNVESCARSAAAPTVRHATATENPRKSRVIARVGVRIGKSPAECLLEIPVVEDQTACRSQRLRLRLLP